MKGTRKTCGCLSVTVHVANKEIRRPGLSAIKNAFFFTQFAYFLLYQIFVPKKLSRYLEGTHFKFGLSCYLFWLRICVLFVSLSMRILRPYEYFLPYSYLSLLYSPLDSSFLTSALEVMFMNLTTSR